jgi:DNA-binding winged helix-turn-helix (wHTH) protein/predicted TPR repeat methyltransferase
MSCESYEFGNFRLDVTEHKLTRIDRPTNSSIPEKAFRTLVHLVRNPGTLLTKEDLLNNVWKDVIVEENNLVKAIFAIRRFLEDMSDQPAYIETVPKHGYRFVADVKKLDLGDDLGQNGGSDSKHSNRSPAFDLFLRGKVKAGSVKREETEAAISLLERAVSIDPTFAEAFAQLARAYHRMAFLFSNDIDRNDFLENAEVAMEATLNLKPDLAEGHFVRGLILWTHAKGFPHEQAIRSYKRSLQIDPNADETLHQLSMVYGHIGLLDEALEAVQKAIEINPNNTMARFRVSNYLMWQAKPDEALSILKTVPREVSPVLVDRIRAEALIQLGRPAEAQVLADSYLKKHPLDEAGSFSSVQALINAQQGRTTEALNAIDQAAGKGNGLGHFHHTAYNIASAYAALNRPDEAVKWLEATADDGFPCYPYFELDPNLETLRNSTGFISFMSGLKKQLEQYEKLL